ncbi:MAG: YbjN domain-containing protein [Pseudomonadota bacterium]|nr:YbjN domain-containing protein [Pseudomonadota bacterium]
MQRSDIPPLIEKLRPGCDVRWVNESTLGVEGWTEGFNYQPSFLLTFFNFGESKNDFDGIAFRTEFASSDEVSLKAVNDFNREFRFVRHHATDNSLVVTHDVPVDCHGMSAEIFDLNYTLFSIATERLKSTLSNRGNEKVS